MRPPLRVPASRLVPGQLVLDREAARYVARVHRRRSGDRLLLFDPEARVEADATVTELGREVRVEVAAPRPTSGPGALPVTVLQALGKGDKLSRVVRDATTLGAARVFAIRTARSVLDGAERAPRRQERWRSVAVQAARQCGRGDLPELGGPWPLDEALERAVSDPGVRIGLDPGGGPLLPALAAWRPPLPLVLAVGPEGGFTGEELDQLRSRGFSLARLGAYTLRTEAAAAAALGAVAMLFEGRGPP